MSWRTTTAALTAVSLVVTAGHAFANAGDGKGLDPDLARIVVAVGTATSVFDAELVRTNPGAADAAYFDIGAHQAPLQQGQAADSVTASKRWDVEDSRRGDLAPDPRDIVYIKPDWVWD